MQIMTGRTFEQLKNDFTWDRWRKVHRWLWRRADWERRAVPCLAAGRPNCSDCHWYWWWRSPRAVPPFQASRPSPLSTHIIKDTFHLTEPPDLLASLRMSITIPMKLKWAGWFIPVFVSRILGRDRSNCCYCHFWRSDWDWMERIGRSRSNHWAVESNGRRRILAGRFSTTSKQTRLERWLEIECLLWLQGDGYQSCYWNVTCLRLGGKHDVRQPS